MRTTHPIITKSGSYISPTNAHYFIRLKISLETILRSFFEVVDLSCQCHTFDWSDLGNTESTMWPWSVTYLMTLTLDFSRSNFNKAVYQEMFLWLMWYVKKVNQLVTGPTMWPCSLAIPMTMTSKYQGQCVKQFISAMRGPIHMERRDVSHPFMTMTLTFVRPWWGGLMYWTVIGVILYICVPSTYLLFTDTYVWLLWFSLNIKRYIVSCYPVHEKDSW